MNSENIYTIMLDNEYIIEGREYPLLGFSYQIFRDTTTGKVEVFELGHPTKLTLWENNGPELVQLNETMVKSRMQEVLS